MPIIREMTDPEVFTFCQEFWERVYCACLTGNITATINGVKTAEPGEIADVAVRAWLLRFGQKVEE